MELNISQAITKGFLSTGHKARQWYLTNGQNTDFMRHCTGNSKQQESQATMKYHKLIRVLIIVNLASALFSRHELTVQHTVTNSYSNGADRANKPDHHVH